MLHHDVRYWQNPELTSINKRMSHAPLVPFADAASALSLDPGRSPFRRSLDGTWQFAFFERPEDVPADLLAGSPSSFQWKSIEVPGCWNMQGYGRNQYTNVVMPFAEHPPFTPERNPTGVYRTSFAIPDTWRGRRVMLCFGSAESVLYVLLNGREVGLSKDSRLAAEFDVTPYLRQGENDLRCVVTQFSDASFIEDQDQWWMAGLARPVTLEAVPEPAIYDVFALGGLADGYATGVARVTVTLDVSAMAERAVTVRVRLYDPDDREVPGSVLDKPFEPYGFARFGAYRGPKVELERTVPGVRAWSHETPSLYKAVVELRGASGEILDVRCTRFGFRSVEMGKRELLVNGKRVMIKGVNRHEHDDRRGKAVTMEGMLADVLTMKRHNVNAVRTSHYPDDPRWYDLCDEYGLYVVDETNLESHAYEHYLCEDPRYALAFLDRAMRMVLRDKNHPSVIMWSLGNESGNGANHKVMATWVRSFDPSRPVHYEGGVRFGRWSEGHDVTDVVNPMYPAIDAIVEWARVHNGDQRPMILCEYSHAMGNSNGSLADYWRAFESCHGLQGGFIWEWADHGIRRTDAQGREHWAYGGDFGDVPNDANFCCDGIVWPDRKPHPGLLELKYLVKPVGASLVSLASRTFTITNKHDFTRLGSTVIGFELARSGEIVQRGELPRLDLAPGEKKDVVVPLDLALLEGPGEYFVRFRFFLAQATRWAPAGFETGDEQIALDAPRPVSWFAPPPTTAVGKVAAAAKAAGGDTLRSGDTLLRFDRAEGTLVAIEKGGQSVLHAPPLLAIWRAPTDNDGIKLWAGQQGKFLGLWKQAGLDSLRKKCPLFSAEERDGGGRVVAEHVWSCAASERAFVHRTEYVLGADGKLWISSVVTGDPALPHLPRVGIVFALAPGFESVRWYGRGPHESQSDRKASAFVGRYESSVDGLYLPYVMPQTNGTRTDLRWLEIGDGRLSLKITGDAPFDFTAHHFTTEDITRAAHTVDLARRPETWVHLDHRQCGVGTGSCGPNTLDRYRVPSGEYRFSFCLEARGV